MALTEAGDVGGRDPEHGLLPRRGTSHRLLHLWRARSIRFVVSAMTHANSVRAGVFTPRLRSLFGDWRVLWPFAIIALAYAGLRLDAFAAAGFEPVRTGDTEQYEFVASIPLWKLGFWLNERGATLPLYYKLVHDDAVRIIGQLAISVASWTYLASAVASAIRHQWLRLVAFGAVLVFSAAFTITLWDGLLFSESLSLSLAAIVVGAWISFVRSESTLSLVILTAATLLWTNLRDTNAYLVLLTVPFIAIWLTRPGEKRLRWVALGSMAIIFVGSYIASDSPVTDQFKRWRWPLTAALWEKVVPDREGLQHLKDAGMPVLPSVERATNSWERGDDWFENPNPTDLMRWQQRMPHRIGTSYWPVARRRSKAYYDWLLEKGRETYASFLLSHPLEALGAPWRNRELITSPPTGTSRSTAPAAGASSGTWRYGRDPLPQPIEDIIYPQSFTALGVGFVIVVALAAIVALRVGASITWWVPVALVVTAAPHGLLTWHATGMADVDRHSLLVGVLPRLGLLMLLFFALDRLLGARPGRRAMLKSEVAATGRSAYP